LYRGRRRKFRRGIRSRERSWMGRFSGDFMERESSEEGREREETRNIVGTPKRDINILGRRGERSLKREGEM